MLGKTLIAPNLLPILVFSVLAAIFGAAITYFLLSKQSEKRSPEEANGLEDFDHLRSIVGNLNNVIVLATHTFSEVLYVNATYEKLWGRTKQSLYDHPLSFLEGIHSEDRHRLQIAIMELMKGTAIEGIECRLIRPDGSMVWVECRGFPIFDGSGRLYRLVGDAKEITERKTAEEQLVSARARIESILASVADIHILFDRQWHYLYLNESALTAIGRPREQILGRTLWEILPELQGMEAEHDFRAALNNGVPTSFECRFPIDTCWEIRCYPAEEGLAIFATNVTRRNEMEARVRKERDRAQQYLDIAEVVLLALDLEGRITLINRKGCALLGYRESELLDRDWINTCLPEKARAGLRLTFRKLLSGDLSYVENAVITKSGEERVLSWRNSLLKDSHGTVTGTLSSGEDITDYKRAEKSLEELSGHILQLQDQERRVIARDLHDSTGQNLVALETNLGLLRNSISPSERKLRALIHVGQKLADQCIQEVRTLSYSLHPPMLAENGLPDAVRHFVAGYVKRTGIHAALEVISGFGRMDQSVEVALFRIVQESLTNVYRHSGSREATIVLERNGDIVTIQIIDQGHGSSTTLRTGSFSAGVGISSMKERVKLIGGKIEILSGNEGTTVRVTVPGFASHQETTS